MTPDEILRDALAKIEEQRRADAERLNFLRSEADVLERRVAEANRAETALAAILDRRSPAPSGGPPEGSAPSAGGDPVPEVEPAAPIVERLLDAGAQVAEAATAAAPQPTAPATAEPDHSRALQIAQRLAPEKTLRQQKMLAGAAMAAAFGLTRKEAAQLLGLGAADLAPSFLASARLRAEDIERIAKELRSPAETQPKAADGIEIVDLAADLLNDMPKMLENCPAGLSAWTIASWLGCTEEQAREAAVVLIREGKAVAENKLLRLPASQAVPA